MLRRPSRPRINVRNHHQRSRGERSRVGRSLAKAITYRIAIGCLDFLAIYLFTRQLKLALGFMLVSNLYTTAAHFLHQRLWNRVTWGVSGSSPRAA